MRIWVDADACPKAVKEILFRAAIRTKTSLILVANQPLSILTSPFIKTVQVLGGFDVADQYIADHMNSGDLVITADIPLADAVVSKNGIALNPRGELYSKENIKQKLSIRNFNEAVRSSGMQTGGPAKLTQREVAEFANCLDRILSRR